MKKKDKEITMIDLKTLSIGDAFVTIEKAKQPSKKRMIGFRTTNIEEVKDIEIEISKVKREYAE